jgi:hypothetical protein
MPEPKDEPQICRRLERIDLSDKEVAFLRRGQRGRAKCLAFPFFTSVFSLLLMLLLVPNAALTASCETLFQTQATIIAPFETSRTDSACETRNVGHRWYESVLRQQQIIAEQIEELRRKFNHHLVTTQDFLDGLSSLFERTDRLYAQWKKLGCPVNLYGSSRPWSEAVLVTRKDMAVGKSLNYLRLSLINFFLGYADSDGIQISNAETQVALSKVWRIRSLMLVKALDS